MSGKHGRVSIVKKTTPKNKKVIVISSYLIRSSYL